MTVLLLLLALGAAAPPPASAQLNVTGQWTTLPYLTPVNPIHVALMHNGKVLIVGGSENNPANTTYRNAVWDPATGTFTQQTTPWDLFCNGMSFLPDGRVIMTGGNIHYDPFYGPPWATMFDPATEKFYRLEDMAAGRWYPTNALLADGGTMTFGGLDGQGNTNTTVEIYDVGGGWSAPYPSNFTPGWYPRLHLLGNGKVFMSGPFSPAKTFDPSQGTWWSGGNPMNYTDSRIYGSSVILPMHPDDGYHPKVMIFGGNMSGATNTVEFIDLGVWPEQWVNSTPMSVPRVMMNAVLLPNGKILTFGGSTQFNDPGSAHRNAETWDPESLTWTQSGTGAYDRLYHSSTLLLPDATVWVAGSNPTREVWEPHMEIYKPPYLFTSAGALAPRPSITSAPTIVGYGQTFTVSTPDAGSIANSKGVILMRPGANTHAFDSEQRLLHMYYTKGGTSLTVTAPTSQGAAPPGYYMLFIINGNGVPSVAKFIQLMPDPTNQPPTATITNPSADVTISPGQSVTFASTANDPDGSIVQYAWIFPGGSPAKSNVQNPGAVTFATPGIYTVSLTVLDNLGRNNASPPTVTVYVGSAPPLGASITSPANGATVTGTVTVNMAASNIQGAPTQFLLKLDNTTTLSNQSVPSGTTASYAWNTATASQGAHTLNLTVTDGAGRTATTSINVTVGTGGGGGGADTTPPTVAITAPAGGATVSGTVTVSATATDNVGVVGVQFKLDGANLGGEDTTAPYGVAWNTATTTAGTHTLTAVARDAAGNTATSAPITVTVGGGGSTGNVVWTNPVNVAVTGNTITKNGGCSGCWDAGAISQQSIASGAGTTSVQFTMSSGGVGTVGLSTANTSVDANAITFGLRFTATYVEVRESGAWKNSWNIAAGNTHKIAVESGVVKYYLNGTLKHTSTVAPSYPLFVDATLETVGSAVQNAVLTGGGDATPPTVTLTAPAAGATVSGTAVTLSATASDNVGVTGVSFTLDGVNLGAEDTTAPYSISWDTTTVTNGSHTLAAVAKDAAGNTMASTAVTVTVVNDTTPPTVSITAPAGGASVSGMVTVSANAADDIAVAGVQFKLDGANLLAEDTTAPYSIAWDTTTATPGTHTLTAVARDAAGNTTTSAAVTVTVTAPDTTSPTVAITAPANGATVSGNAVTVSATASDNVAVAGVQFKLDGANLGAEDTTAPYAITWDTTAATPGTHTLTAVARDTSGNTTTSAAVTVTVTAGGVVWVSPVNVTVNGNSITKTSGCSGCWDAGAISQQTIASGNGSVQFTVSAGAVGTVGLSNGNTGQDANEIKFGLRFQGTYVEVRESGAWMDSWNIATGDVHKVAVEGGVVKYYQNGTLKHTSTVTPTYPLLVDTTLETANSAVLNAIMDSGSGGGAGGGDTTPPTVSITDPVGGATVAGTIAVSATASDNVAVVGVQFKLDGVNLGAEDTAAPYTISWDTTTATQGTHTLTAVARDAAGNTTTSAPVTVTVSNGGGGGGGTGPQNVVWTSAVNVAVSGNTITKNAGCSGCWDAGAVSQQTIASGNGSVQFTVSAGAVGTVGLSTGNTGQDANEIKFGLRFQGTYVEVRESGAWKDSWNIATGDVHKVAIEGTVVKYYLNGTFKYQSALAPTYPALVDATLETVGNAVQNAVITIGP